MGEHHDKIRFDEQVYALYADFKHPLSEDLESSHGASSWSTPISAGENNGVVWRT